MSLKKKFELGNLILPNNIIYAPLAEYTDFSFRKFIRFFHKGLIFCEMIKMEALLKDNNIKLSKFTDDMHPIGAQICGSNIKIIKEVAKIIEDKGFDLIDLNCGCPTPKTIKDGSGAALLKKTSLIFKILSSIKSSVKIPVTIKTRLGWDENTICVKEIVKIAKEAGASAVTIHGRTKTQGYSGKANWDYIKECKDLFPDILIIGNGDLYTPMDVEKIFKQTKCDAVMIGRGMLKNPNIANEIEDYFNNNKSKKTHLDKKNTILKYIEYCIEEKGEKKAIIDIRKMSGWFLKNVNNIKQLRIDINAVNSVSKALELIKNFEMRT